MNNDYWHTITFSVDLITATLNQLKFLKEIDQIGHLYSGFYFDKALYRYENIWLPLLADKNEEFNLVAPIDVQWIWHLHMLSPISYLNDCQKLCNKVFNHSLVNSYENDTILKSKELWEEYSNVPYNYLEDFTRPRNLKTNIEYDIRSASLIQKGFFYQISLPHYENKDFISVGVDRYKKYLFMKKYYNDELLVPCFLIDLIWHSHLLYPLEYYNDINNILGYVLSHDGEDSFHSSLVQAYTSDERTSEIWRQLFDEEYFKSGTLFRGLPIDFSIISTHTYDPKKLVERYGIFEIESLQLNAQSLLGTNKVPVKEFKVSIYRMFNNKKEELFTHKIKTRTKFLTQPPSSYNFTESIPETLILIVSIEGAKSYKKRINYSFTTKVSISKHYTIKPQVHEFEFQDEKSSIQYTLLLSLKLILQYNRRVTFYLHRNQFYRISSLQAERILANMQTPIIGVLNVNSMILRAKHKITVAKQGDLYDLEILNIDDPPFSALKIILDNKTVAISKLIGNEQLPKEKYANCLNLNNENERAMLVQHAFGDYAIIKAQYLNINKTSSALKHLRIHWYSLLTKTNQIFELKGRSLISITNSEKTIKAVINLKSGFIYLELAKRVNHFEAFLAGLFSVTYLYVFIFQNSTYV